MVKLSKRIEYALLAVQEMARQPETIVSAKDIADRFDISFTLLAKVLQQLVHAGYVRSYHGVHGGYELAVASDRLSVADVIVAVDGRKSALVECQDQDNEHTCSTHGTCTIREPLAVLQERIMLAFTSMTVQELAQPSQEFAQPIMLVSLSFSETNS
ncbi:MAG: Rrf2 family transcriptional regulator [bacterium]|nr:Rrf2 family transcriptional regulator [bacterium]